MARKHVLQMSDLERDCVNAFIHVNVHRVTARCAHYEDKAKERSFTKSQALEAVKSGYVIEVHNNKAPDIRAVVRDKEGTCVVVSLKQWSVVTVYYNAPDDHHETLDFSKYRWEQDLTALIRGLMPR